MPVTERTDETCDARWAGNHEGSGQRTRVRKASKIVPLVAAAALLGACTAPPSEEVIDSSPIATSSSSELSSSSALSSSTGSGSGESPAVETEELATGLAAPWSIAFHGETALISERDSARILELTDAGETRTVGAVEDVVSVGEGGLLGLAVREGWVYAYYTTSQDNRIERFEITGQPGSLSLSNGEVVLEGIPAAATHNGGRIAFGPDGMLYATTGDVGDVDSAQDPGSLAGKILRTTPEGANPEDNPFDDSPVYSYGHRNPQGLGWDSAGTMYSTEFGQATWDELNIIEPGGNYGWPEVEGLAGEEGFIDPVQQWAPAEASPSGMAVGAESIVMANLRGERLWEIPLDDLGSSRELLVGEFGRLRDVVVAPDDSLWVLTNNTDGRGDPAAGDDRILRIVPE